MVASSDDSGFLEAEISVLAVNRMSDDHVIKYLDLENPGSFVEPPSQAKISLARARVSGCGCVMWSDDLCAVCRRSTGT
jgi:hypothetical protein